MDRYPLLLMFALLGIASLLARLLTIPLPLGPYGPLLGWGLLLCGALLIVTAAGLFRTLKTTINPTKAPDRLVVDGLYRLSRNPMYLGMLLVLTGFPLIVDSLPGFACTLVFYGVMDWRQIPREERVIEGAFGDAYRAYKLRTRRWL